MADHRRVSDTDSLVRVKTEELLHYLDSLPFDQLNKALQGKRTIFPEEFITLLSRRYFHTAIQYESLDRSHDQTLLTDTGVFSSVLELVR